jgi:hypothetical protein
MPTFTPLAPGDIGIDFSGASITAAQAKKNGAKFLIRYSAGVGNNSTNTQWKLCKTGEIPAAEAAGIDFIANSEWYESRITEGHAAGVADGLADLNFWKSRGLAKGATIYVSWDATPSPGSFDAVAHYLKGYADSLGGYYEVGLYAGTPALKEMLKRGVVTKTWRPNAGSWSDDGLPYQPDTSSPLKRANLVKAALAATPANFLQTGNYWFNKSADENVVLRSPVGSHLEAKAANAKPAPKPVPTPDPTPRPKPVPTPTPTPTPKPKPKPDWRLRLVRLEKKFARLQAGFKKLRTKLRNRNGK